MNAKTEARTAREVPTGTLVIYAHGEQTYRYEGPSDDPRFPTISFAFASGKSHHELRCEPSEVAPADITIPAKDDRVSVVKQERGKYPTWSGPWLLTVDGEKRGFFKTKKEGTARGLRVAAILDWHAATPSAPEVEQPSAPQAGPFVLPHTGMTVPNLRLTMRKLRSHETYDGEAYTAELLVDGKPAGTIQNDGNGGETVWHPLFEGSPFSDADMAAYVAGCRDADGEPQSEWYVLGELFDEHAAAAKVAKIERKGEVPVRTMSALYDGDEVVQTFPGVCIGVPAALAAQRERLASAVWRKLPDCHGVQVWTGTAWESLNKPA